MNTAALAFAAPVAAPSLVALGLELDAAIRIERQQIAAIPEDIDVWAEDAAVSAAAAPAEAIARQIFGITPVTFMDWAVRVRALRYWDGIAHHTDCDWAERLRALA